MESHSRNLPVRLQTQILVVNASDDEQAGITAVIGLERIPLSALSAENRDDCQSSR